MSATLTQLFYEATGQTCDEQVALTASGSNRRYYRLFNEKRDVSLVGVKGTTQEENEAFIYMSNHFKEKGLNVPKVVAVSEDKMNYLQEDLGDTLLFNFIAEGRKTGVFCTEEKEMIKKTIYALPEIQIVGNKDFDYSKCYPQPEFNKRSILWDLNYFKYCFLKSTGLEFQENELENDFENLANILLQDCGTSAFMYRDFQSRNVMIKDGEPYFIDFQGGRKGPVYYDVASFLWQAKANFHSELRNEMIDTYLDSLQRFLAVDRKHFLEKLQHFVLFRTMQVLGAYGFRGYFEKKPHFLQSIPFAIENLRQCLIDGEMPYPYLAKILKEMTLLKQFNETSGRNPLVVKIYSFAYKKGIPLDDSGNGGGYVFDCRAVNNPGKYEKYTYYTGMDEPVIKFLEENGEMAPFLHHSYELVDASVKRYIDRGFQHLMVCFGCTGGQHRSVYAAERMAEHLNDTFGVEVQLIHREQNIQKELPAKAIKR